MAFVRALTEIKLILDSKSNDGVFARLRFVFLLLLEKDTNDVSPLKCRSVHCYKDPIYSISIIRVDCSAQSFVMAGLWDPR